MSNKIRKDVAVSMFDVETKITDEIKEQLAAVDGVFRVRVVK